MDNLCARLLQAAEFLVETHAEELPNTLKSYSTVINLTDLNDLIYLTDLYDLTGDLEETRAEEVRNTLE
jgi:hypothetical protein